jgi:adenine deaminase
LLQRELINTALGLTPPDLYLHGGSIVNVFSGEIYEADIAIKDGRIAYVGKDLANSALLKQCRVIDVTGFNLLPGYIEPHCHPTQIHDTVGFTRDLLQHGITTVVADSNRMLETLGAKNFIQFMADIDKSTPVKVYWLVRLFSESYPSPKEELLSLPELEELLSLPRILGIGETTRWTSILQKDSFPLEAITMTKTAGKRADGHTAGAGGKKLSALAAAGISGCHESVTSMEVLERLRNGMYLLLRHSSQRPDLDNFLEILLDKKVDLSRFMLTCDGTSPAFLEQAWNVAAIAELMIKKGVDPLAALRMITSNPATYFRIDHEIGAIAPGRAADIVITEGFELSRPHTVIVAGQVVCDRDTGILVPSGDSPHKGLAKTYFTYDWQVKADIFDVPALGAKDNTSINFPVIEMVSAIITKKQDFLLPVVNGTVVPGKNSPQGLLKIAHLDMQKRRSCTGFVKGLARDLEGFASSLSCAVGTILAMGSSDEAMALAARRVLELGGGIVLVEKGSILWEMRLELVAELSSLPYKEIIRLSAELEEIMAGKGYPWGDFFHTLIFLPCDYLPYIRIGREGLFDVLSRKIIYPSVVAAT